MGLVERVVATIADQKHNAAAPSAREARRVIDAIRLVESDAARPVRLQDLAATARMSKYHFLRVFRRLTGVTPYQYLLSARMRRAALELASSRRPVLAIALDSGFGDLSTFNQPLPRRVRRDPDAIPRVATLEAACQPAALRPRSRRH